MKEKLLFLAILFFFSKSASNAQQIEKFGAAQLSEPFFISAFIQTNDGYFWMGSPNGFFRFDGFSSTKIFIKDKNSDIIHNQIIQSDFYLDEDGLIWFSTYSAFHSYNRETKSFNTYQFNSGGRVINTEYRLFHLDNETNCLWLRAGDDIWKFELESKNYFKIHSNTNGYKYATTVTNGKIQIIGCPWYNSDSLEYFTSTLNGKETYSIKVPVPASIINAKFYDKYTAYGTSMEGLFSVTISNNIPTIDYLEDLSPSGSSSAYDLNFSATKEEILVSRPEQGLCWYSIDKKEYTRCLTIHDGLSSNSPREIHLDNSERIWLSQYDYGLDVINSQTPNFESIDIPDGEVILDIEISTRNNILLVSKSGKIFQQTQSTLSNRTAWINSTYEYFRDHSVFHPKVFKHNNSLLFQSFRGVFYCEHSNAPCIFISTPENTVQGLHSSPNGRTLMVSNSGVQSVYLNQDSEPLISSAPEFRDYQGTYFTTILHLSDTSFILPYQSTEAWYCTWKNNEVYIKEKILLNGDLNCAEYSIDGSLILGTTNGLYRFHDKKLETILENIFSFPHLDFRSIALDNYNIWLGTNKGLFRLNSFTDEITYFSTLDGLPSNQFSKIEPLILNNGCIVMMTNNGLIKFDPTTIQTDKTLIQPYFDQIWVNDIPIDSNTSVGFLRSLDLPHYKNDLDFRLSSVSIGQSELSGISYQLINFEHSSTFIKNGGVVRYPNLPPGNYTFRIQAINRNGNPSEIKILPIIIHPPFHQTLLFRISALLTLFFLIGGIYNWLLRRELAKQARIQENLANIAAERDRIASEVHDDLGGQLSSILFLSEGLAGESEIPAEVYPQISRIHELSKNSLHNVRDIIFALDNRRSSLSDFLHRMEKHGRTFFADRDITFNYRSEVEKVDIILSSRQKRNLGQIIKEAYHNIFKHAAANWVQFKAEQHKNGIRFNISDDGKGFTPPSDLSNMEGNLGNFGLENMYKKAKAINAELQVRSRPDSGTTVTLWWPLNDSSTTN
ncbi:MAG: ATP-binding protein [Bacteroidota bacterium]